MPRPSTIPSTPVTDHDVTMMPTPAGPSARGTTSVQTQRHRPGDDLAARERRHVPAEAGRRARRRRRRQASSPTVLAGDLATTRRAGGAGRGRSRRGLVGRAPTGFAGTPPTIANGGTSRVTTAPAATTLPRPSVTPGRIVARVPIQTWSSITTRRSSRRGTVGIVDAVRGGQDRDLGRDADVRRRSCRRAAGVEASSRG